MKWMWIAPNRALHLTEYNDQHMLLPDPFTRYKVYHDFYVRARGFKVLDNGMFETGEPINKNELLGYAEIAGATEIVLPDVASKWDRTRMMIKEFVRDLKLLRPQGWKFRLAGVVQGRSYVELKMAAGWMLEQDYIDTIMIPKRTISYGWETRAALANWIADRDDNKAIHFLGFNQEHPQEWEDAGEVLRSCDCTHPFKTAMVNLPVNHPRVIEMPRRPRGYWQAHLTSTQLDIAQANIEEMEAWVRE